MSKTLSKSTKDVLLKIYLESSRIYSTLGHDIFDHEEAVRDKKSQRTDHEHRTASARKLLESEYGMTIMELRTIQNKDQEKS